MSSLLGASKTFFIAWNAFYCASCSFYERLLALSRKINGRPSGITCPARFEICNNFIRTRKSRQDFRDLATSPLP